MSLIDGGFLLRHLADSETVQARRLKVQAESPAAPPPPPPTEQSVQQSCYVMDTRTRTRREGPP